MNNNYVIAPQSDIFLLKAPLEMDSKNQMNFTDATAQHNYFASLQKIEMDNATYQRKDERLYFEGSFDTCLPYNYCMYKNEGYSNKWFYAFVTDMRFESNNSCSCRLVTDVFQTWLFNFAFFPSFIERSHVPKSSDVLGAYTYPEGLETGEYKVYTHNAYADTYPDRVILGTTVAYDDPNITSANIIHISGKYNGLPSACGYYSFPIAGGVDYAIGRLASLGVSDSIVAIFMYPSAWAPLQPPSAGEITNRVQTSDTPSGSVYKIDRITSLDGYTPRNKKLLTSPFCYILLSNGVGTSNTYRQEVWELDENNQMTVYLDAVLCPGGSVKVYPFKYNGSNNNYDEGFSLGKYPELAYPIDVYTNWEVQNGTNLFGTPLTATETRALGNVINGVQNLVHGNVSELGGSLRGIWDTMQEQYRHAMIPPAIGGNINAGDVSAITGAMGLHIQRCGIKEEYARKIDSYFDMFGYKLCTVATPNITSRSNWNYIKTIDINLLGDIIPEDDMQRLKDLFNTGFTIWHNPATFLDYSQANN